MENTNPFFLFENIPNIRLGDYESLVSYIRQRLVSNTHKTVNKYLVVLHGPPSSGKSLATRVACRIIYDYFEKTVPIEKLKSTFLNTNIDNLTYDTITTNNTTVREELLDNMYNVLYKKKNKEVEKKLDSLETPK